MHKVLAAQAFLPVLVFAAPTYKDVARIFASRCYGCHVAAVKMGSLDLQTYDGVQQGGNNGQIVVPGKSDASRLYLMIAGKAEPSMPMDGSKLDAEQIETIRNWIDAGAPGPATSEPAPATRAPAIPHVPRVPAKPQIFDLKFSPDGTLIALAGFREIRLLNREREETILKGAVDTVRAVAFSKDGSLLAAAGGLAARQGEVLIYDVRDRKLIRTIKGHTDCISGVAFSPDGRAIATAGYDQLIRLWDVNSAKEIRIYKDHTGAVNAVAFTPDGKYLVSGSADRTVKVWNAATGERLYTLSDSQDGINTVAINPAGTLIGAGGLDKTIRVWKLGDKTGTPLNSLIAHEGAILRLAWSPDGEELISSSADKTVRVFKAGDLAELRRFSEPDCVYGLQFAPDGKTFAIGRLDGSLAERAWQ